MKREENIMIKTSAINVNVPTDVKEEANVVTSRDRNA